MGAEGLKLEAIAYEADGTSYQLGVSNAMSPKAGTPTSAHDANWYTYSKALPEGKKIVKIGLRLTNGGQNATVWGMFNIDDIVFSNTVIGDYTRIDETGWTAVTRTSETPTVAVDQNLAYCHEGETTVVLSGGVTPDAEFLKSMGMSKTLATSITGGYLEYKVYMDAAHISKVNDPHYKTKAIVYDATGTAHDLGLSDSILRYSAWLGGGFIYGGWFQYRVALRRAWRLPSRNRHCLGRKWRHGSVALLHR